MEIGDAISRMRNIMKAVKDDAFVTDRFIYSVIFKYAKALMYREDFKAKLMRVDNLFTAIPCMELIEVDKIEACCFGIDTGCKIMRTEHKIPDAIDGVNGPILRNVASLDRSVEVHKTDPKTFTNMAKSTNFKYNKSKYYWWLNGYLYFPNIPWEAVTIEGIFEEDTSFLQCNEDNHCIPMQEQSFPIPDYLFAEVENMAKADLGVGAQLPPDGSDNNQNTYR